MSDTKCPLCGMETNYHGETCTAGGSCAAPAGAAPDAEWGRALWDWLREMLPDAGCCLEFDTDDLMRLAEKHGRARRVKYEPHMHVGICGADPGDEIWWWGDDLGENVPSQRPVCCDCGGAGCDDCGWDGTESTRQRLRSEMAEGKRP
jgi:hypothetical protein